MSIGSIDIELDRVGMNLVLGKNQDDKRFDSNGSAKSALFEAMTWGLFGEFLRDLSAESFIRTGQSKMTVEVLVDPEDGSERVWFKRTKTKREHTVFATTEKGIELFPANSVKDIQPQIDSWLGLDFKTFTNSVYFGKGLVKFFMASNDTERKDLLETILQLVSFDEALERAKALSKKCSENITEYNTAIAVAEALKTDKSNSLVGLQLSLNGAKVRLEKEQPVLKAKAVELQETRDKIFGSIGKLDHLITKEKELYEEEENAINISQIKNKESINKSYDTKIENSKLENTKKTKELTDIYTTLLTGRQEFCKSLEEKQAGLLTKKFLIEMDVSKTEGLIEAITKDREHVEGLSENIPCKECFQKIPIIHKNSLLIKYNNDLIPYYSNLSKWGKEIEIIDIEIITGCTNPLEEVKRVITEIENTQKYKLALFEKEKFDTTYGFITKRDNEIDNLNKEYISQLNKAQEEFYSKTNAWVEEKNIRNIEVVKLDTGVITIGKTITEMEESYYKFNKQVMSTNKEIEKISKQEEFAKEKIIVTNEIDSKTKFWIEGFGPRGIKSFIFESALPYLTARTNHYSSYITGGTVAIDILPTTVLKSGETREKLTVSAINSHGANVYNGNSDGERRRIDICVLLALQDLISTRASKTWSIIVFDEIFDCLDKTGIEHVIDMFRTFKGKSIYIISHSEDIKKHFDTSITIVKKDGISYVEN
jgi:hypothetical protein